jgi:hypothetical protein
VEVIHHALDTEALLNELPTAMAEPLAQGGVLSKPKQAFVQSRKIAWPQ